MISILVEVSLRHRSEKRLYLLTDANFGTFLFPRDTHRDVFLYLCNVFTQPPNVFLQPHNVSPQRPDVFTAPLVTNLDVLNDRSEKTNLCENFQRANQFMPPFKKLTCELETTCWLELTTEPKD